jgi:hypothetical protein
MIKGRPWEKATAQGQNKLSLHEKISDCWERDGKGRDEKEKGLKLDEVRHDFNAGRGVC